MSELDKVHEEWSNFKSTHQKEYPTEEEENLRKEIFKANFIKIHEHNKRYKDGLETFEMGINKFADLKPEEMKCFTGYRPPKN